MAAGAHSPRTQIRAAPLGPESPTVFRCKDRRTCPPPSRRSAPPDCRGEKSSPMPEHSLVISPRRARGALAGLRFGLAAGSWLTPRTTGRLFGLRPDANPVSPYLTRLFGARAAWLGTEILLAESSAARRRLIRRHMAIDVADLAATLMGWQRGYLNRRGGLLTGLSAVTAIGLALRASSADPDGSP
jgi:hypothetical protein